MGRLFIAEKSNMAKAIATGIGIENQSDGFFTCTGGDVVTWAIGHLLENYAPDDYNPDFKKWEFGTLPIIPEKWKLKVVEGKSKQLSTIKKLAASASSVVNAGDPDREGSLLIDEIIRFLSINLPVYRILLSDLNIPAVKKALASIKPNQITQSLSDSALARSRADWLVGMNLTRGFTIAARESGAGVLSVGRVQTPVLGLVVRRDLEIESFKPHAIYGMSATFMSTEGEFQANWQPLGPESYFDENGNLTERAFAESSIKEIAGGAPVVETIESKSEVSKQPLPFSLSELQKVCSKALGLTLKQTLEIAQNLYEKHQVTTYPRSDCGYLPEEHHGNASSVFDGLIKMLPEINSIPYDVTIKSHAFNDSKVRAHHAIIPTGTTAELSKNELAVFEIIARRYVANFLPEKIVDKTKVAVCIEGTRHVFTTTGSMVKEIGWGILVPPSKDKTLPKMTIGEALKIRNLEIKDGMTKPPEHFTEDTLLSAMTGITKHLNDKSLASALKDTDGLGTEATRAEIFETLVKRTFIEREKGKIKSTKTGRAFIAALPQTVTYPDKTALWESDLNKIVEGELSVGDFLNKVSADVSELVALAKSTTLVIPQDSGSAHNCPQCSKPLKKRKTAKGDFWGCSGYPDCSFSCNDIKGEPELNPVIHSCPDCGKRLYQRKSGGRTFWGCGGYPECKTTFENARGKPVFNKISPPSDSDGVVKNCPSCSKPMKLRIGPKSQFWGCSGYPECKQTEKA